MKKFLYLPLVALSLPISAIASANLNDIYFKDAVNPVLTRDEISSLEKQNRWNEDGHVTPFMERNGIVQFVYGTQTPSILCAVFQLTDISLEPGEKIHSLHLGDTARWNAEGSFSGSGSQAIQHIIVKPLDVGLDTTMIIETNKRMYHLKLRSHKTKYMAAVSFKYPEEEQAKMEAFIQHQEEVREGNTLPTGEYLGNLDFHYTITGQAPWRPVRVYNDGQKTVIELPDNVPHQEAPSLLVMSDYSSTPGIVNSRLQGNRFIVDQLFSKAVLIAGVGGRQKKVVIVKDAK